MKRTSWVALVGLATVGSVVVLSSLHTGGVRCEVCIEFRGSHSCRTVDGASEQEALAGARTNACALLASGVTDTLACERTTPSKTECRPQ